MDDKDRKEIMNLIAAYGDLPIIMECVHVVRYDSHDDHWSATYDIRKLMELDDFALGYVRHIIKTSIEHPPVKSDDVISGKRRVYLTGSVKYSFRDCEDWYASAIVNTIPADACVIDVDISTDCTNWV